MLFVIGWYLLLVVLLPVMVSAAVAFRSLPVGRHCPCCHGDTIQLTARALYTLGRVSPRASFQRRWCLRCGWQGVTRIPDGPRQPEPGGAERAGGAGRAGGGERAGGAGVAGGAERAGGAGQAVSPDHPGSGAPGGSAGSEQSGIRATHMLDLRSLEMDGSGWRVMLQCWSQTGMFYGRLIFIGPPGRLWLDTIEAFSGADENEVRTLAMALPEPLLESRLRRLVRR